MGIVKLPCRYWKKENIEFTQSHQFTMKGGLYKKKQWIMNDTCYNKKVEIGVSIYVKLRTICILFWDDTAFIIIFKFWYAFINWVTLCSWLHLISYAYVNNYAK